MMDKKISYDKANRLKRTIAGTDTFDFDYWDTGQIKKLDYPNGVKEQYELTSRNFIDIVTDSSGNNQLFKSDYKYNEVGDRDTLIFKLTRPGPVAPITGTIAYKYDDLRRVTEAKYPRSIYNKTNKYTYDKTGNRKREIAGRDTTDYSYNKRNNQLTDEGLLKGYYYDDNGNLVKFNHPGAIDTLFYDFENRLEKFVEKSMTIPPTYDTLWFTYCGMAKRIRKIEKPNGQSPDTTSYAYDGMYAVCEFGGHLDLQYKYIYANGMLLARYDASPADTHYYHHDGLGSIMGLSNESGNVEQSYFYDEFGNSLGSWGSADNHYLYTGQEYDGSISSLYNLRARYYDKSVGRFVQEDKVSPLRIFPQTSNNYVYTLNSPLNLVDPLGLWCIPFRTKTEELGKYVTGTETKKTPWRLYLKTWHWYGTIPGIDCFYRRWKIYYELGWTRWLKTVLYWCYEKNKFIVKTVQTCSEEQFKEEKWRKPEALGPIPGYFQEGGEPVCPDPGDLNLQR